MAIAACGAAFAREDTMSKDAGKVGVWTKADSVTHFAGLSAKSLQ